MQPVTPGFFSRSVHTDPDYARSDHRWGRIRAAALPGIRRPAPVREAVRGHGAGVFAATAVSCPDAANCPASAYHVGQ